MFTKKVERQAVKRKSKRLMLGIGGICVLAVVVFMFSNTVNKEMNEKETTIKQPESGQAVISYTDWYMAYSERLEQENNLSNGGKKVSLAYLDDNDIPECIIWSNPYADNNESLSFRQITVLSYHEGEVLAFVSELAGSDTAFSYKEKSGKFCVEEVLGLRSATCWEIVELTDGLKKIGSVWQDNNMTEWYYSVNEEYTDQNSMHEYMKSFGFNRIISGACAYSSLKEAYDAWNTNRVIDCESGYSGDILPESSSDSIREQSLFVLSKEQLRLAKNEIYARHGYIFKDEELKTYFEGKSWYVPANEVVQTNQLNKSERLNLELISRLENPGADYFAIQFMNYIEYELEDADYYKYSLIEIDEDNIPEIFCYGDSTAQGMLLLSYYQGTVYKTYFTIGSFYYIEGENEFYTSSGRMDYYMDDVFYIEKGEAITKSSGRFGMHNHLEVLDDKPYTYKWNDVEVTEEEYNKLLEEAFDKSRARCAEGEYCKSEILSNLCKD